MNRLLANLLCVALLISARAEAGEAKAAAPANKDAPKIEPTYRGRVEGFVFDRETREPIEGARVVVEQNGEFAASGKTVATTDKKGYYRVEAALGTRSSKFDLEQALLTFPLGLLIPGGMNRVTKVLYVTQLNVRVEKSAFKTFCWPVHSLAADANKFFVQLDDIWLAPESSSAISLAPRGQTDLYARRFVASPTIVQRGQTVKVETELVIPRRLGRINVWCVALNEPQEWTTGVLKPSGRMNERTRAQVFKGELDVPRRVRERAVVVTLVAAQHDALYGNRVPRAQPILIQVAHTPEEQNIAEKTARGFAAEQAREFATALGHYDEAALLCDFAQLHPAAKESMLPRAWLDRRRGALMLRLNRPREAADLFAGLAESDKEHSEQFLADYGAALLECGQPQRGIDLLLPLTKDRKRSRGLPPEYHLALARCFLAKGEIAAADEHYIKASRDALWSTEFVQEFNLDRVRAAMKTDPQNADAQLAYGHALAGMGRYEQALVVYRQLLQQDERQPWVHLDMAHALTKLRRHTESRAALQRALEIQPENLEAHDTLVDVHLRLGNYEQAFEHCKLLADSPARQRDFFTRHRYAILLLWKDDLKQATEELARAIYLSRGRSEIRNAGLPTPYGVLPFSAKRSLSTGFNRFEAEKDSLILRELRALEKSSKPLGSPEARLAQLNIGIAMVELGFEKMGLPRLQTALRSGLDGPELHFIMGAAYAQLGDTSNARAELELALAQEPTFGDAYLKLAELSADEGDADAAQKYLLKHAQVTQTN